MKTYEVRYWESDGTVATIFVRAKNAEHLFRRLSAFSGGMDVIGYNVVEG
jgi:hypothetical protein